MDSGVVTYKLIIKFMEQKLYEKASQTELKVVSTTTHEEVISLDDLKLRLQELQNERQTYLDGRNDLIGVFDGRISDIQEKISEATKLGIIEEVKESPSAEPVEISINEATV